MQRLYALEHHKTSISLPHRSYRRVRAVRKILARNGIDYSEQEIYRRLFKLFLKFWRGRGLKSATLRRYNADGKSYEIHPLYINQVLHAALWERAIHSGESISRMLDLAIRVYMPRLLESLLSAPRQPFRRFARNALYWETRLKERKRLFSDFFINYVCKTEKNDGVELRYQQSSVIIPKTGLSPWQILNLLSTAA